MAEVLAFREIGHDDIDELAALVAAGQARARRFDAREGFVAFGEPFKFGLGLPVLEYRRSLESPAETATACVSVELDETG
jgi:hypothetical protein